MEVSGCAIVVQIVSERLCQFITDCGTADMFLALSVHHRLCLSGDFWLCQYGTDGVPGGFWLCQYGTDVSLEASGCVSTLLMLLSLQLSCRRLVRSFTQSSSERFACFSGTLTETY